MKLVAHPDTLDATVEAIDAEAWQSGGQWHFRFRVDGADALVVPPPQAPGRADGLWQRVCFEAFVGTGGESYVELNFSPSRQWAAYRFDAYRAGMRDEPAAVAVKLERGAGWLALEATVECAALVAGAPLGLSAVIEERDGKSYWALGHPAGRPDFHDRACFTAALPDIGRP